MNNILKNAAKFVIGTCLTLGAVTVATSIVAGKNIYRIMSAGFTGAKNAVAEELAVVKSETASAEESAIFADKEESSVKKD